MPQRLPVKRGDVFGFWTVTGATRADPIRYEVRCRCGAVHWHQASALHRGTSTKCKPCANRIRHAARFGGVIEDATIRKTWYHRWHNMLRRCLDPSDARYPDYGARGITVDPSMLDFNGFCRVIVTIPGWDQVAKLGRQWSLDRIDNARGYTPGNLRMATMKMQQDNARKKRKPRRK